MKTKHSLPESILHEFCSFVKRITGWNFPPKDWESLRHKITSISTTFGYEDPEECLKWLMKNELSPNQMRILARYLTIGETYFFRDSPTFEKLENVILPALIKQKETEGKKIKIWSTACSTGEEPYSIAIMMDRLMKFSEDWDIQIIGTDINTEFLEIAKKATYKAWSFRGLPEKVKKQYFHDLGHGKYVLNSNIQSKVQFQYLNLVEDSYPSMLNNLHSADIILCNNVLIYFSTEQIHQVIKKISNTLSDGGWLIVSPIEAPYVNDTHLKKISSQGTICFYKCSSPVSKISSMETEKVIPQTPPRQLATIPQFPLSIRSSQSKIQLASSTSFLKKNAPESPPAPTLSVHEKCKELFDNKEYDKMIRLMESPELKNQMLFKEMALLAKAYANLGKFSIAKEWTEKALKLEKLDPFIHFLHGTLLYELGSYAESEKALRKAIYLDPSFILAHFALGNLSRKQQKKVEMKRHFRNALKILSALPPEAPLQGEEGMTAMQLRMSIEHMYEEAQHE